MAKRLINLLRKIRIRRPAPAPAAQTLAAQTPVAQTPVEPIAPSPAPPSISLHRRIRHLLKQLVVRVYTLGVLLLVAWAGYMAVSYLLNTVFVDTPVPRRLLAWQGRNDIAALRAPNAPGLVVPAERAPIGHFHRTNPWFQPDPHNGCTPSGCHDPLPHSKKMKVPAFANFHATFMACQMCHAPAHGSAVWLNIENAQPQDPPAILRLVRYLETETDSIKNHPADSHQIILPLLRSALLTTGNDPALEHLLLQLDTSEPGSPVWRMALAQLTRELPTHVRGEYAAKLAREQSPGEAQRASRELQKLAKRYLAEPANSSKRPQLHQAIHGTLQTPPATCLSCHGDTPSAIDYAALGYSPRRAQSLSQLQLARLMQQIRQGEQFFIPRLLESGDAR